MTAFLTALGVGALVFAVLVPVLGAHHPEPFSPQAHSSAVKCAAAVSALCAVIWLTRGVAS